MSRLLDLAATLEPPFVLLESGVEGTQLLAWGAAERRRAESGDRRAESGERRVESGERRADDMGLGDGWIGAISYDAGVPEGVVRREPMVEQPLIDLFRPINRIVLPAGGAPVFTGPDAPRFWLAPRPPCLRPSPPSSHFPLSALRSPLSALRSFTPESFAAAVKRALEYIRAGDIYQVNLSVAEVVPAPLPALEVYRRLRDINPSPWMGFADFGDWQLVCGSPELLVEVKDGIASARPIAGTRRRTGEPAADDAMRRELLSDRKEAAEHIMLVDLARNDLGMVSEYGSVTVAELGRVEEYSHVMHLVSDVTGRLAAGQQPFDAFRAMFPGGTITGCPKIRSMEIIAELEPVARGMYTGALGWWEGGRGQWNILIRSAVVRNGRAVIQAGAGIVADSDPAREWKESLRKAQALREAFGVANSEQ